LLSPLASDPFGSAALCSTIETVDGTARVVVAAHHAMQAKEQASHSAFFN
jgi:hypothetical protein